MNVHNNARLTPKGREDMVRRRGSWVSKAKAAIPMRARSPTALCQALRIRMDCDSSVRRGTP